jgi:hypothetical protein
LGIAIDGKFKEKLGEERIIEKEEIRVGDRYYCSI